MAAATTGWAQWRGQNNLAQVCALNGIFGTGTDPRTNVLASAQSFEVTAGVAFNIRWGYNDPNNVLASSVATNTTLAELALFYDDGSTATELTNPVDSSSVAGGATTLDRTKSLTLTKTGTVRIRVRVRTFVTTSNTTVNDVTTDHGNFGSAADALTAVTFNDFTPGLLRFGTTFSTFAQSGLGGSPGVYHETETNTCTFGAAPNAAFTQFTHTISWRSAPGSGNQFTTTTITAYTSTTPNDGGKLINNVFPNASTNMTWNISSANSNLSTFSSGSGLPWIHWTTAPAGPGTVVRTNDAAGNAISVEFQNTGTLIDPRLTLRHLLQVNQGTFSTPPLSKESPTSPNRLTSDLGFYSFNVRDARGTNIGTAITRGVNGITVTTSFQDTNGLVTAETAPNTTSTTLGGEAGWFPLGDQVSKLKSWSDALPGGKWTLTVTVVTSDAQGITSPLTQDYFLLAPNLDLRPVLTLENTDTLGNHWHPGDTVRIGACVIDRNKVQVVAPDGNPKVAFLRFNQSSSKWEFWSAGNAWTILNGATFDFFNMGPGADATSFVLTQGTFSSWSTTVQVFLLAIVGGVPYFDVKPLEFVSKNASFHNAFSFDPTGGLFR